MFCWVSTPPQKKCRRTKKFPLSKECWNLRSWHSFEWYSWWFRNWARKPAEVGCWKSHYVFIGFQKHIKTSQVVSGCLGFLNHQQYPLHFKANDAPKELLFDPCQFPKWKPCSLKNHPTTENGIKQNPNSTALAILQETNKSHLRKKENHLQICLIRRIC